MTAQEIAAAMTEMATNGRDSVPPAVAAEVDALTVADLRRLAAEMGAEGEALHAMPKRRGNSSPRWEALAESARSPEWADYA